MERSIKIGNVFRHSPPRRGGVARQLNRSWRAGVVSPAKRLGRSSIEASPYRARASRHLRFVRRIHPSPARRGMRYGRPTMRKLATMITCVLAFSVVSHAQSAPKIHESKATTRTVHRGFFDASLKPVLTINSGDIVKLETASGNPRYFEQLGVPKEKIPAEL